MDKIKQLIGSARYKLASDLDYKYTLNLNNDGALIKNNFNKIIYTINQEQVFREERLKSTKYRILGKLNILTDNDLGYGDPNGDYYTRPTSKQWSPEFNGDISSKTNPNNWVLQILYPSSMDKYNYVGKNQAYRGISVTSLIEGVDERTTITTQQRHGLVVDDFCYIYSLDSNNNVYTGIHKVEFLDNDPNKIRLDFNYQQPNIDNLLIKKIVNPSKKDINFEDSKKPIEVEHSNISGSVVSSSNPNANYIKITTGNLTPALINDTHNLNVGDYIEIRVNDTNYGLNGLHRVEKTINRYQFLIDLKLDTQLPNNVDINYRRLDGIPSDYYIRNFTLLTRNDYDVVKATSFGRNIYPETSLNQLGIANEMWLFNFTEDVDVNELYSHRGGQTTQLYFATIKTSGNNPYPWTDVTAHWDFNKTTANSTNGEELICKYDWGSNGDGFGTLQKKYRRSSRYIGDFVEYNRYELLENTLSDIIHMWSTNQGGDTEKQLLMFGINEDKTEGLVYGGDTNNNNSLSIILPKTYWTFDVSINLTPKPTGQNFGSAPINTTTKYWIEYRVWNNGTSSNIITGTKGPFQGPILDEPLFTLSQNGIGTNASNIGQNLVYIHVYAEKPLQIQSSLYVNNTTPDSDMSKIGAASLKNWYGPNENFGLGIGTGSRKKQTTLRTYTLDYPPGTILNSYYIHPFQKLEIRKFSNIIEKTTNAQKTLGIPGDAEVRPNGDVIWRDILEPGYIENGNNGVNFPFLNGSSYIYLNKNIFIRKQIPDNLDNKVDDEDTEVSPIKVC